MLDVPKIFTRPGVRVAAALPTALALAGAFAVAGPLTTANAAAVAKPLVNTHPGWASNSADRGAVAANSTVATTVYLAGRNPAGLTAYATAVADPASASYHKYLTPAQFSAAYGATQQQIASVEAWLRSAGLKVTGVTQHSITASGTVAANNRAYGTRLDNYSVAGGTYRAPASNAVVPAAVGNAVLTVVGLTNMPVKMKPAGLEGQESTPTVPGISNTPAQQSIGADKAVFLGPTPCSAYFGQRKDVKDPAFRGKKNNAYAVCGYTPAQLRGAYGVTSSHLTGAGVRVAIVDAYGSSTILKDANQYAVNHGDKAFAKGQFTESVTPSQWIDQSACQGAAGWAPEETLDVEAVHAMAPAADVHYYGANSCNDPEWLSVFTTIVDTHSADLVSDSWGGVIYSTAGNETPAVEAEYTQVFEQGAIEGISFNFSAGDCGAENPATACGKSDTSTTPQADYPASNAWVTSVGGTSLAIGSRNQDEGNAAWGTDVWELSKGTYKGLGWNYGGGGGTSASIAQPWYQKGIVPTKLAETLPNGTKVASPMRVVPDVSMDADPTTGYLIGMTQALPKGGTGYAESAIGGTSLACPLFVGLQADAMQKQGGRAIGFANPAIYMKAGSASFNDVPATGLGATVNMLPPFDGYPTVVFNFGDDGLLKATKGYDDATGVGTPSASYLSRTRFDW